MHHVRVKKVRKNEDYGDASIQKLVDDDKKSKERLFTPADCSCDNKSKGRKTRKKQKCEENKLYGYFKRQTGGIAHEIWTWLRKENLKVRAIMIGEKNNAKRTNFMKVKIYNAQTNKDYKTRHDGVGKVILLELYKRLDFDHTTKQYIQKTEFFIEKETQKIV